jgi:TRAP-type C4-dicarboxylate transport system permease large subunit
MDIIKVAVAAAPFFLLLLLGLALIVVFPGIVTMLPNMMGG